VYIIDEVHRLSGSAFDALLKTLEEPPPHVIFVMATTDPLKVPETILSRTQRFDFRRVNHDDLAANMRRICDTEGITVDPAALSLLARKADGSVRDSLSLLDQIAAFAGDTITPQDVVNALGLVDQRFLVEFIEAVAASDRQRVLVQIKQLFDSGIEIKDFVLELMEHLRNLMILRSAPEAVGLTELGSDELAEIKKQAEYFTLGDILRLMKIVSDVHTDLRSGLDERLLLETAAVKMAHLESTVRFEEVLAELRGGTSLTAPKPQAGGGEADFFGGSGRPTAAVKSLDQPAAAAPVAPEPVIGFVNMPQLQASWNGFAALLRRASPMVASQLNMARLQTVHENRIKMMFPASATASKQLVSKSENLALIHRLLREQYRVNLTVEFGVETQPEPGAGAAAVEQKKADPAELLKTSPRLRSIVERVDGEIIGIRQLNK
jgi:DNA polymerase-3 subunit gamma/tau